MDSAVGALASGATEAFVSSGGASFLVEATREVLICLNGQGDIVEWGGQASHVLGFSAGEVVGQHVGRVFPQIRDAGAFYSRHDLPRAARGSVAKSVVLTARHQEGHSLLLQVRLGTWEQGDETYVGLSASAPGQPSDVQLNLERLAQNSSDLLLLLSQDGTIEFMSRDVPGLSVSEAPGTSIYDYLVWEGVMPQNRLELEEGLEQLFATGRPFTYESWGFMNDGTEAWYWCRLTPEVVNDKVVRAALSISDVTERHQRDEAMQHLALITQSTNDAVISTDKKGLVTSWNDGAYRLFGYCETEAKGNPLQELIAPADFARREQFLQFIVEPAERSTWEGEHWTKGGWTVPISVSFARLHSDRGEVTGVSAVVRDTSAQKSLENALRAAKEAAENSSRAKTDFLANMSHEIRTPMNGITGMAELLLGTSLTGEQQEYVETLQSACGSLRAVIDDILDVSKLEAGHLKIEEISFDPTVLVRQSVALFAHATTNASVPTTAAIEAGLPRTVVGDPHRIRQVLNNLVGNAKKFTRAGTVTVSLQCVEHSGENYRLRFEVRDTGVGIAPDALERIFEPFGQADSSITRKFGGTGLGLTICRQLVALMGGKIGVESRLGQGATFWFELSLQAGQEDRVQDLARVVTSQPQGNAPVSVLLAEDNLINQKVAKTMLRRLGCTVKIASNGRLAVEYCEEEQFDMVFMDCQMPEVSGFEATASIRESGNGVPIVAMTAQALEGDREACLQAGMDDYISKPISVESLTAMLDKWGRRQLLQP